MSLAAPFSGRAPDTAPPQQPPTQPVLETGTETTAPPATKPRKATRKANGRTKTTPPSKTEQIPTLKVVRPHERPTGDTKDVILEYYTERINVAKLANASVKGRRLGLPNDFDTMEAAIDCWNQLDDKQVLRLLDKRNAA